MAKRRRLTPEEIENLPIRSQLARDRALEALNLMRSEGLSATAASKRVGTTLKTVKKYAGRGLEKDESGEWDPKPWDRIIRPMKFPTPTGLMQLDVRDSRSASKLARYWADVREFVLTGNEKLLVPYRSETIQVRGDKHHFVTDPDVLKRLAKAGEISFSDIYDITS